MKVFVPVLILTACSFLVACDSGSKEAEQTGTESRQDTSANNQAESPSLPPIPKAASLPASIDMDPCALLSEQDLNQVGIDVGRVTRSGGADRIPDGETMRPFVSCQWYSEGGIPLLWVQVQDGGSVARPPDDEENYDVGEGAWEDDNLSRGRTELRVKAGDRLLRIVSQALALPGDSAERNVAVARMLLPNLDSPLDTSLGDLNPSRWGGPSSSICELLSDDEVGRTISVGDNFWAITTVFHLLESQAGSEKPVTEGAGCRWQSDRRPETALHANYLGPDGKRAAERIFREPEEVDVAGRMAKYSGSGNESLLVALDENTALHVTRSNLYDPQDEDVRSQLVRLATQILEGIDRAKNAP